MVFAKPHTLLGGVEATKCETYINIREARSAVLLLFHFGMLTNIVAWTPPACVLLRNMFNAVSVIL